MNVVRHIALTVELDAGLFRVSLTDGKVSASAQMQIGDAGRMRGALRDVDLSVSRLLSLLEGQNK